MVTEKRMTFGNRDPECQHLLSIRDHDSQHLLNFQGRSVNAGTEQKKCFRGINFWELKLEE
jgi:hypothetical protein